MHAQTAHVVHRAGVLRASVLGANDGIVSIASLIVGVASAGSGNTQILIAGLSGLVAGAMSMAAGEYVSVSSQSDAEKADLEREARELLRNPEDELEELTLIYMERGLERPLAAMVAEELTKKDALGAHARDELGILSGGNAQPVAAAVSSALSFALGAGAPLLMVYCVPYLWPDASITLAVAIVTLLALVILGALGAYAGGAPLWRGAVRVLLWGALSMAATAAVGHLFGLYVEHF